MTGATDPPRELPHPTTPGVLTMLPREAEPWELQIRAQMYTPNGHGY